VGQVTLKSNSDGALSSESLEKSNGDEALISLKSNSDEAFSVEKKL
jgi:hypothetical protein